MIGPGAHAGGSGGTESGRGKDRRNGTTGLRRYYYNARSANRGLDGFSPLRSINPACNRTGLQWKARMHGRAKDDESQAPRCDARLRPGLAWWKRLNSPVQINGDLYAHPCKPKSSNSKLSDTARLILSAAGERKDSLVFPLPESLAASGAGATSDFAGFGCGS